MKTRKSNWHSLNCDKKRTGKYDIGNCLECAGESYKEILALRPKAIEAGFGDKPQHTPTPWKQHPDKSWDLQDATGEHFLSLSTPQHRALEFESNAAFIVRAVNRHEELLELAKGYYYFLKSLPRTEETLVTRMHIENIIAKAEGK